MLWILLPLCCINGLAAGAAARHAQPPVPSLASFRGLLFRRPRAIALEGCSIPGVVLQALEELGFPTHLLPGEGTRALASAATRAVDQVYRDHHFFGSRVSGHRVSAGGRQVTLKCVEEGVPVANFKFFVRDAARGAEVDVGGLALVQSSSARMPHGKFVQEPNSTLRRLLFGSSGTMRKLDPALFSSIQRAGLWRNLEYAIWRGPDGQLHMHCFCDGPGITRRLDYTLANLLSGSGTQLRLGFSDLDLLGSGLHAEVSGDIGVSEWYKMSPRHKLRASVTYDALRRAIWSDCTGDTVAATLTADCALRDLLEFLRLRMSEREASKLDSTVSGTLLLSSGPERSRVSLAADANTVHMKVDSRSHTVGLKRRLISVRRALSVKLPIETLRRLDGAWRDKVSLQCEHTAATTHGRYNVALGLRCGSDPQRSGFRGDAPHGKFYFLLAGDVTRSCGQQQPLAAIRPGLFLDAIYLLANSEDTNVPRTFALSAGVVVKVLGFAVSLALSEIPRNMPGGLRDLLTALRRSFYAQTA